jgi:MtN3 and saliva related transmembrane protein
MADGRCDMTEPIVTMLGLVAGVITSAGFLPQLARGYRTKKLDDISYYMPIVLAIGMMLWLLYGILLAELPIIAANAFGASCSLLLIAMKKRYST